MPGALAKIHVTNVTGLIVLLVMWVVLFKCAHVLMMLTRHEPLLGWAIGPFGISVMFLHEPSLLYIWFDVVIPACVSGIVLYTGLFTSLSPLVLPHYPFLEMLVIIGGVALTSTGDVYNALRDMRHPLWGEARVLRSIQFLRATWARIHFTPFGYSYLNDHFGASPTDLLQVLS